MDRSRKYEVNATYNNVYEVKAAFVGYIGDIVALSVGGYVEAADGTNVVIGVLKESVDNTKGGNGDKEVLVDVNPKVWLPRAGASISDLFKRVYATGTNAVALGYNPTTKKADGIVIDYRTDEVLIDFLKGDTAPEAGSGDFLANGSVPMTGNFKLGGKDIWLNAAGTSKIANDRSDNFTWTLDEGKKITLTETLTSTVLNPLKRIIVNYDDEIITGNFLELLHHWTGEDVYTGFLFGIEDIKPYIFMGQGFEETGMKYNSNGISYWADEIVSEIKLLQTIKFKDSYLSGLVNLSESGVTSLTASGIYTSLIGVINDLNARITALEP